MICVIVIIFLAFVRVAAGSAHLQASSDHFHLSFVCGFKIVGCLNLVKMLR